MRNLNLAGIDLNLLVVLEALLDERHVTRAGQRVGLSQPATTSALNRLRRLTDDPILVRSGNTMQLTERALEIRDRLGPALASLKEALEVPAEFDPATSSATIRLATLDSVMLRLLPGLLQTLAEKAPLVDLELHPVGAIPASKWLREGRLDLAIGVFRRLSPQLRRESLYREETVCVLRSGHPALDSTKRVTDPIPLDVYLSYPHLRISGTPRDPGSVARALPERMEERRVACRVPDFLPAPFILEQTDLIAILSASVAERFAEFLDLTTRPNPIELPIQDYDLVWSSRLDQSPLHSWFRELVATVARGS